MTQFSAPLSWKPRKRSWLFRLFAHPAIGRPLRKFIWLVSWVFRRIIHILDTVHHHMPYVVSLDEQRRRSFKPEAVNAYYNSLRLETRSMESAPKISVILPFYKVKAQYLREAIASVEVQAYENWELCVVDDATGVPELAEIVREAAARHPGRVHFSALEKNGHICAASNRALDMATGEYVTFLDHDDRLMPNALAEVVRAIMREDHPDVLYSDEQLIDAGGTVGMAPFFKPGWSKFLLLAHNYVTHLAIYRTELVRQLGGLRLGFEGAQDHDLILRATEATRKPIVHVPFSLYQWRMHPQSTAKTEEAKPYAAIAGEKAISEALVRRGIKAETEWEDRTKHFRVRFALPQVFPKISIVVAQVGGQADFLGKQMAKLALQCVGKNLELVVVGDRLPTGISWPLGALKLISCMPEHSLSARINQGVHGASGEYIVLLGDDVLPQSSDWLDELLRFAQFPEVGAVGCKVLYADDTLAQAGYVAAGPRVVMGAGMTMSSDTTAHWSYLLTPHEVPAVGRECLMMRRQDFHDYGGFDAVHLPGGYADVDLCLRMMERGKLNLFTPYAAVIYQALLSDMDTPIVEFERHYMLKRWGGSLLNEPYMNPNLVRSNGFHIDAAFPALHAYWFFPEYKA